MTTDEPTAVPAGRPVPTITITAVTGHARLPGSSEIAMKLMTVEHGEIAIKMALDVAPAFAIAVADLGSKAEAMAGKEEAGMVAARVVQGFEIGQIVGNRHLVLMVINKDTAAETSLAFPIDMALAAGPALMKEGGKLLRANSQAGTPVQRGGPGGRGLILPH